MGKFKLSDKQELILKLINQGHNSGLDMVENSNGILKRGTIYIDITALIENGLVWVEGECRQAIVAPRGYIRQRGTDRVVRYLYQLTDAGKEYIKSLT